MQYGFILPHGDARTAAKFANEAEKAGWDGFFVWEPVWGIDAWVSLTAAAMRTKRIRLGTMLSPVSRMRPWKLASETATLDNLSKGRVILAVGLGAVESGFAAFGEVTDRKIRAELLDEGLEILTNLWHGQPFSHHGKHYQVNVDETTIATPMPPPPVQQPRIPIWVVGAWPRMKSMQRVLRYDGLLPFKPNGDGTWAELKPDDIRAMKEWLDRNRAATTEFDIIMDGKTPGDDRERAVKIIRSWADAGVTWWLETMWETRELERVLERIGQGPPQME